MRNYPLVAGLILGAILIACRQQGAANPNLQAGDSAAILRTGTKEAPRGADCIANFVRPGTALARDLAAMYPRVECTKRMVVFESGRTGYALLADSELFPPFDSGSRIFPPFDFESRLAPRLVVRVLRFAPPSYADWGLQFELDAFVLPPLPEGPPTPLKVTERMTVDGNDIELLGFYVLETKTWRHLVCVGGSNRTTGNSEAVICRSTDETDEAGTLAMADQIIRSDFLALRF